MIRVFDFIFSLMGLIILLPLLLIITILGFFDTGSPLFFQRRIGLHMESFNLIKFRTMKIGVQSLGTHLIDESNITSFGKFIRRFKIDELPQLWNVLIGEMSLVGPRPCLFNQDKLIYERKKRDVFNAKPGITGLAQISGVTMKSPIRLAKTDLKMISNFNVYYYFYYIFVTFIKIFKA